MFLLFCVVCCVVVFFFFFFTLPIKSLLVCSSNSKVLSSCVQYIYIERDVACTSNVSNIFLSTNYKQLNFFSKDIAETPYNCLPLKLTITHLIPPPWPLSHYKPKSKPVLIPKVIMNLSNYSIVLKVVSDDFIVVYFSSNNHIISSTNRIIARLYLEGLEVHFSKEDAKYHILITLSCIFVSTLLLFSVLIKQRFNQTFKQ